MTSSSKTDERVKFSCSRSAFDEFYDNVSSFWCEGTVDGRANGIPTLEGPPSSLEFLRDFVSPSRPCLIRNVFQNTSTLQPKFTISTLDDLVEAYPSMELQVDITPDGHGDCVRKVLSGKGSTIEQVFVRPLQVTMTTKEFRKRLRSQQFRDSDQTWRDRVFDVVESESALGNKCSNTTAPPTSPGIVYFSQQNDCLRTTELAQISSFFPSSLHFAEEAIGTGPPDAVNLWIGNECCVSSLHRDPYENLFHVLNGTKLFYLCPPANALLLKQRAYSSGTFVYSASDGQWKVQLDSDQGTQKVQWIAADPTSETQEICTDASWMSHCHVLKVYVQAGEMLYLPSLWFHKVTQTMETMAINYWYDMNFDAKWCYFQFLEAIQPDQDNEAPE